MGKEKREDSDSTTYSMCSSVSGRETEKNYLAASIRVSKATSSCCFSKQGTGGEVAGNLTPSHQVLPNQLYRRGYSQGFFTFYKGGGVTAERGPEQEWQREPDYFVLRRNPDTNSRYKVMLDLHVTAAGRSLCSFSRPFCVHLKLG
jgi:hypothetical protein